MPHDATTPPPAAGPGAPPAAPALRGLSSMATRELLHALAAQRAAQPGAVAVAFESVGGVDAARRVAAGEAFDVVVLAADAIARLAASGALVAGSERAVVHSQAVLAVPAGAPRPALDDEDAVRGALRGAASIGFSTGPSGDRLRAMIDGWGLTAEVGPKLVQAPPGVPVARLLAERRAALGFQQLSEFTGAAGVDVVGPLPGALDVRTTFTAAVAAASARPAEAADAVAFLAGEAVAATKRRLGMIAP